MRADGEEREERDEQEPGHERDDPPTALGDTCPALRSPAVRAARDLNDLLGARLARREIEKDRTSVRHRRSEARDDMRDLRGRHPPMTAHAGPNAAVVANGLVVSTIAS